MNYHESIENIELKVIPKEITFLYKRMLDLLVNIRANYADINMEDISSFRNYRNMDSATDKRSSALLQLSSLRKIEQDLLDRERKLEDKLITGEQLSSDEYKLLTTLKEKRDKISKNKDSILKAIHYNNNNISKFNKNRMDSENDIEIARKSIKYDIEQLILIMQKLEEKNLGINRLKGLSVKDKHIQELNTLIYKIGEEKGFKENIDNSVENIDKIFENSLEIRINMFKDIYNEVNRIIKLYKNQQKIDFVKINELEALGCSDIWKKPYSIYPYGNQDMIDINSRHLSEYANIIELINAASKGKLNEEEVDELKSRIHDEYFMNDMSHNYLLYKEANLSQYLTYVKDRVKENKMHLKK